MKRFRLVSVLVAAALPSCLVYNGELIDGAIGSAPPGDGDGDGDGGTGGGGGLVGNTGGMTNGGSGGGGTGATTGGGGSGDGDGDTGGMGMGGGDGDGDGTVALVHDLEQAATSYFNDPFVGTFDRYGQTMAADPPCMAANWDAPDVESMRVAREDDAANHALAVKATDLDCWGVGVYLTLNEFMDIDISGYTSLAFSARTRAAASTLKVKLADPTTNQGTCTDYCDQHATAAGVPPLTMEWQDIVIPMTAFRPVTGNTLELSTISSIHFTMDPTLAQAEVDFLIDNIRFIE